MDAREWRLLLAPDEDDPVLLSREKARELLERLERLERLEAEVDRLRKVEVEFREYKKRHPETVGVKFGKPYAIRTPTEPRTSGGHPGARVGHPARLRPRPSRIDRRTILPLTECPRCHGHDLSDLQSTRTRVVEDLPAPCAEVTEYALERRYCRGCHRRVESPVPGILPHAQLGLRLMHTVVQLNLQHRVAVEQIPPLLARLYGIAISEGEVHGILEQMARAYGPTYERFRSEMREAPAKYLDETPWRVNGGSGYLWVGATPSEVVYHLGPSRGHTEALALLGPSPKGVLVHDRFGAYETVGAKTGLRHQACWFHRIGDAEELVEFLEAEEEGKQIHGVLQTVYHAAKQVAGRGTEEHVRQLTEALVGGLSNRRGSSSRGQRFVEGILEIRERLFGFVTDARVEGTNNRAERALRPLVVARGRSAEGVGAGGEPK